MIDLFSIRAIKKTQEHQANEIKRIERRIDITPDAKWWVRDFFIQTLAKDAKDEERQQLFDKENLYGMMEILVRGIAEDQAKQTAEETTGNYINREDLIDEIVSRIKAKQLP